MTRHITGTNVTAVTTEVIGIARSGDLRALRVTMLGQAGVLHDRPGIVTPHLDEDGDLDVDALAAQIWAIAMDEVSDSGSYAEGVFTSRGDTYMISEPIDDC